MAQNKVNESVQTGTLKLSSSNDPSQASTQAISSLDQAITRLQTLKRKLSTLNNNTVQLQRQSAARIHHLDEMYQIPTLVDVKYEEWSKIRLDRLLVDYLLRMGYTKSGRELAKEKNIELLVDVDEFEGVGKIETSLSSKHQVDPALAWCTENKKNLKKMENNSLEYELRLQQHIELCRNGHEQGDYKKLDDARLHASKYFKSHPDQDWKNRASGLLVIPPSTNMDPYHVYILSPSSYPSANITPGSLLTLTLDPPLQTLPLNPPRNVLPPQKTSPSHGPRSRSLCPKNTRMPLQIHIPLKRLQQHHITRSQPKQRRPFPHLRLRHRRYNVDNRIRQ